jgi:transposase InsO family protein
MDMTSVWVAEHGWAYLNAIVDCCTREIPAWGLDLRCRKEEALIADYKTKRPEVSTIKGSRPARGPLTPINSSRSAFLSGG